MVTRIGIVGFGWVARDYMLPAIQASPGAELRAVVSVRPADFEGLPSYVGTFVDVESMLRETDLDAVYIASPNHLHRPHAVACLEAGLHVLCEKPLAHTCAEAMQIVAAAERSKSCFLTAFDQRYHPAHERIAREIAAGTLGKLTQIRIDYACWLPADWCADNWRIDPDRAGGGAVIDLAPHGLDLVEHLSGQRITELHTLYQRVAHDYGVDDGGMLMARLSSGALASLSVGYNRPETLPRRRLEIFGTKGMFLATNTMGQEAGGELRFISAETGSVETEVTFDNTRSPFAAQLDYFLTLCSDTRHEGRSPADDLRLAELLESCQLNETLWH
ncbi:Gfo/Idh/MocA family protein [Lewinella sp. IMCC34191]|uniref:Gfo/Idh/MocA family protein n=1 Tax=Lewinella sp. IMCC34191 TaxID=2259172 RepID=UPI000E238306|nr:Gfo/Idh/MocA family oxidoreductase [Lewinella sp. IMCC34191]